MKKLGIVFLILTVLFVVGCVEQKEEATITEEQTISVIETEALNSTYVSWYGRIHYQDEQMYFYHTATGFKLSFYGRVIEIEFVLLDKVNDIYYSIAKDGEDVLNGDVFIQSEQTSSLIVEFDTYDYHTIEVVKRSEPEDGITAVKKIATNGYFIEVEKEDTPHFLMIGASGISGHGALGSPGQQRTTANSSSLHSFGHLTAQAFQGSYEFVASSGWGLAFGFNDRSGQSNIAKAFDYVGINPNRDIIEMPYIHAQTPDYIIINIGGNDYTSVINRLTGFERTEKILEFKDAVATFILKLRAYAPNAHILWTMTEGSMNGTAASEVIDMLDSGDRKFVHVVIIKQVGEDGDLAGANNHASYATHQKSAQNLIQKIESILEENENIE